MNEFERNDKVGTLYILKSILIMLIPCAAARALYILYSVAATDVTVQINPNILLYSSTAMSCIFVGGAFAAIQRCTYRYSPKKTIIPFVIYAGCCFVDRVVRFCIDYFDGGIRYREKIALVTLSAEFFTVCAIAFCAWILGVAIHYLYIKRNHMRKYGEKAAINAALLLNFAVPFIRWIVTVLETAIDADWILTVDETNAIVADGITVVVMYALVAFIGSRISLAVLRVGDSFRS